MDVLSEPGTGPSPALPSGAPTVDPGETADGYPTRQLCPYLAMEGGGWRSAHPSRDHRCAALTPPAILALEKQRRLCLGATHRSCATYMTAEALDSGGAESAAATSGESPASVASDAIVTRWALVRTVPVVLDHARVPVNLGSLARGRTAPQLMLGGLLVLAFLAVALGRLPGQGGPTTAGLLSSAAPSPSAPASPTPRPTLRPSPSPLPSLSVAPSQTPTPSASPKPATRTYTVRAGDFLLSIANRFGTTVKAIVDLNNIKDPSALQIGQVLKIP